MFKVGAFIKFIADLNPQGSPARLAFYNWLRGFSTPDQSFSFELVEKFFADALDYPHWIANRNQLSLEVKNLITQFNRFFQTRFDLNQVLFPENMQIIEIEHDHDAQALLSSFFRQILGPEDKFRVFPDQQKRYVVATLDSKGRVQASVFDRKFTIKNGLLQPLRQHLTLKYDSQLKLETSGLHHIEIAPYVCAQFRVQTDRIYGAALRGFMFQNLAIYNGEKLEELPKLHYPVLRIEQFFVNRQSDALYQNHIQTLKRAISLAQAGDESARQALSHLSTQADTLLEQVYINDLQLSLLAREARTSYAHTPQ